jgi:hypothetical protein
VASLENAEKELFTTDEEDTDGGNDGDENADDEVPKAVPEIPHYVVAKQIPADLSRISLDRLETAYYAPDFLSCLEAFLKHRNICPRNFNAISEGATYPLYRRLIISIPPAIQCSKSYTKDPIRATAFVAAKPGKKAVPAHFDTVLARMTPEKEASNAHVFDAKGKIEVSFHPMD